MKLLLENWREYLNEADTDAAQEFINSIALHQGNKNPRKAKSGAEIAAGLGYTAADIPPDNPSEAKAAAKELEIKNIKDAIVAAGFNHKDIGHRLSAGRPWIEYELDKMAGEWNYTAHIPNGDKVVSSVGEELADFLERVGGPYQMGLNLFESWRNFLNEEGEQKVDVGIHVKEDGMGSKYGNVEIIMLDLDILKNSFIEAKEEAEDIEAFTKLIRDRNFYENSFIGYIKAANNEGLAGAIGGTGSGGLCYKTWSNKEAVVVPSKRSKGYGSKLFDALLGWGATNDIYLTADRTYNSPAAERRWVSIDKQTNDEVPPKGDQFSGYFDGDKSTPPLADDCVSLDQPSLNKGYKNKIKSEDYKKWKNNLDTFFSVEVQALFDQPGFFGKLLGNTPEKKTQSIKNSLFKIGYHAFAIAMQKHFNL
jgi:GNAT superfamily N-acetyltransferase